MQTQMNLEMISSLLLFLCLSTVVFIAQILQLCPAFQRESHLANCHFKGLKELLEQKSTEQSQLIVISIFIK